ncbi:MAG: hypothetical protein ABEJ04_06435 [Halobacteriaceae archaeon]
MSEHVALSDLALAAYCPRKLYYARRADADRSPPPSVERRRELAFAYPDLLAGDGPPDRLAVSPSEAARRLRAARERFPDAWAELVDPAERDVRLTGRDCRGDAAKVLALDPPVPTLVSAGDPPDDGVWEPQRVRAVGVAKALAWREERAVERAFVEYPAHGVVREVRLTGRTKAAYRRALRTVRELDGPPPRLRDDAKCEACEFRGECGVRTRTLGSLLG